MSITSIKHRQLYLAVAASLAAFPAATEAQEDQANIAAPAIEEVLVLGRLKSSAESIIGERMEQPFAADILGGEQISRTGDSNVAAALVRVTGVTLIEDQYVYVRSLGERYSSTQLNGAAVPSPELTRNVLPLDLIPAAIVDSLKVQKAWSPDLPANFGGGNIDIRTKSIPEEMLFKLNLGVGTHSASDENALFSSAPADDMPPTILNALDLYAGGTLSVVEIQDRGNMSRAEAQQINRNLALSLERNIEIQEKSLPLDYNLGLDLGNSWDIGDDLVLGAVLSLSRDDESRNKNFRERGIGAPDNNFSETQRSLDETSELGSLNAGITYDEVHKIAFNSYLIRNNEAEASIKRGHNASNEARNGDQIIQYETRFEERELEVLQAIGEHSFDQLSGNRLKDIKVDWFSSDATATTDIPLQTQVSGANKLNTETGEVIRTSLLATGSMASYTFLDLEDQVRSRGANVQIPIELGKAEITVSGGYSYNDKAREYFGYTAKIGATGVTNDVLSGTPGSVLTDANLSNLNNSFELTMGSGLGTESYLAGQITDAGYGMVDFNWDYTWRITAGARYENFRQGLLPVDLLDYSYVQDRVDELQDADQQLAINHDDWYPSIAVTFMNGGFMGTETFQVRTSFSQTVVRPDLRETSPVAFLNEDQIRVFGNPLLASSEIDHADLRTEWFYGNGDNFTVSLFYKDLVNPIEQSRRPGSDDNIELTYYNAESGEIYGIELEGLKDLGAGFFLSSNITLSDSEIISPDGQGFTNLKRRMTGHSEYVVNALLGYDSEDSRHSVSVAYNVSGERIYYATRNNNHDDAFEQPFNSLDVVYSFYPTERFTTKLKINNLLDEKRVFEQVNSSGNNVVILERDVGIGLSLDFTYTL